MVTLESTDRIAACRMPWAEMDGTPRVRYCESCRQYVYNLEGLSDFERESIIERHEGDGSHLVFVRFDGTIVTRDRPRDLARAQHRVLATAAVATACALSLFTAYSQIHATLASECSAHIGASRTTVEGTLDPALADRSENQASSCSCQ